MKLKSNPTLTEGQEQASQSPTEVDTQIAQHNEQVTETIQQLQSLMISESDYTITYARSSGSGGQKVNKTSSKAILTFNIQESSSLTAKQRNLLQKRLENRITKEGNLVIHSDEERSQSQNKENAINRLHAIIREALTPQKKRNTHIPAKAKAKRTRTSRKMKEKTKEKKRNRKKPTRDNW